jgi:hypothetical protein
VRIAAFAGTSWPFHLVYKALQAFSLVEFSVRNSTEFAQLVIWLNFPQDRRHFSNPHNLGDLCLCWLRLSQSLPVHGLSLPSWPSGASCPIYPSKEKLVQTLLYFLLGLANFCGSSLNCFDRKVFRA